MGKRTEPTKSNLIRLRQEESLARNGLEILDHKREILLREFTLTSAVLARQRKKILPPLKELFRKTRDVLDSAGPRMSGYETLPVPGFIEIIKGTKRVMGVKIPVFTIEKCEKNPHPMNNNLDTISAGVSDLIPSIIDYAQSSCAQRRIAQELSKTRKREKAIEEIHLPRYRTDIIRITESLDENEREELSRYKSLKRRLSAGRY